MEVKNYLVLRSQNIGVHWGWWLFWMLVCWPVLLITAIIHFSKGKIHEVRVVYSDDTKDTIWLTEEAFVELKTKKWENSL